MAPQPVTLGVGLPAQHQSAAWLVEAHLLAGLDGSPCAVAGLRMAGRACTWAVGCGEQVGVLLLAFLKNTGFGEKDESNLTKSLSILTGVSAGLKALMLSWWSRGRSEAGTGGRPAACAQGSHPWEEGLVPPSFCPSRG